MTFHGTLDYKDSNDYIKVTRLIVREDHLAFQLTTTWADLGKWSIDGLANKAGVDEYVSGEKPSHQGIREGLPCSIRFRILSQTDNDLSLEGSWSEAGETYEFEGELELSVVN